jgi:hypothetical protein
MREDIKEIIPDFSSFRIAPKDDDLKVVKNCIIKKIKEFDKDVVFIICVWMRAEDGSVNFKVKISYDKEIDSSEWTSKKHKITSYLFSTDVFNSGLKRDSKIFLKLTMLNSKYNGKDNRLKSLQ